MAKKKKITKKVTKKVPKPFKEIFVAESDDKDQEVSAPAAIEENPTCYTRSISSRRRPAVTDQNVHGTVEAK